MTVEPTVLVVDDESLFRKLLRINLTQAGYHVLEADSGRAALALLRENVVDAILLDLVMPEMDGFQVLRKIKSDALLKDIPIVVLSASDDMNSVVRCIEMGAMDHLSKPFDPVLLQVRIRAAIALRQMEAHRLSGEAGTEGAPGLRRRRAERAEEDTAEAGMKISEFLKSLIQWSAPYRLQTILFASLILICLGIEAALPMGFKFITDDALIPHDFRMLIIILGILIFAMAVSALAQIGTDYLYARIAVKILNDLRFNMFRHLQQLSLPFFSRVSAGEITSRFTTDLAAIENTVILCLQQALSQCMMVVFTLSLLFVLEWRLALFALFGIYLCFCVEQRIEKPAAAADARMKKETAGIAVVLQDVVGMQPVIKAYRLQNMLAERFKRQMVEFFHTAMRACFLSYLTDRAPGRFAAIFGLLTIAAGSILTFYGFLTIGGLVSFQVLLTSLVISINELTWSIPYLVRATGGMEKIESFLNEPPETADLPDAVTLPPPLHEIVFENVSFGYTEDQTHLESVCFSIPMGRFAVLIGPSGGGKSTVLHLLMRFYDPREGSVSIDGHDLRNVTRDSLRQHISAVFQENFLFNATIRENIRAGKQEATDDEIETAARMVGLHETIVKFPAGYDTMAGERGGKLSAGLRQQIAIARAIISDPPILLLDDATSALDPATAALIDRSLEQISQGRTVISVTHRLEAASRADLILLFQGGRLKETGSHAELIQREGIYAKMWRRKTGPADDRSKGTAALNL
jgi:ATP-binding cassette subfamily B protein